MIYNSLLLNSGGGIIPQFQKSAQSKEAAVLAIGIGGTGVRALSRLKQKVYQQLKSDNEEDDSAVKLYKHIQFLAIDSDETDFKQIRGEAKINADTEFISIQDPALNTIISHNDKKPILDDPRLNWMDIDHITALLAPHGAGGVRQLGRYMIIKKAQRLSTLISGKINLAMENMPNDNVHVYIFAGISGGTGSGCFLDTCYIVRKALKDLGIGGNGKIMGFFFLPDVVTSKREVAANRELVLYNESNGYAAIKELDYLMNLRSAKERFKQVYDEGFVVDTDEPPVDMCHLISAKKADGTVITDGFKYCIHVAADYVMSYLAVVDGNNLEADDTGLTMSGHLANVTAGVGLLPKDAGVNLNYHILGAANAEIPMTQIATYLTTGFIRRFHELVGVKTVTVTKDTVNSFAENIGLSVDDLIEYIHRSNNYPNVQIPDADYQTIYEIGSDNPGVYPRVWVQPRDKAIDSLRGVITYLKNALTSVPDDLDVEKLTANGGESLQVKIFLELCKISAEEEKGPYFASAILGQGGYNLINYIEGQIRQVGEYIQTANKDLYFAQDQAYKAQAEIFKNNGIFANKKKLAKNYKDCVQDWFNYEVEIEELKGAERILETLRISLRNQLKDGFFSKLINMLDNIKDTFKENGDYLNSLKSTQTDAYTIRLVQLTEVRDTLDEAIKKMQPNQLVTDFINRLLKSPKKWLSNDDTQIGQFISTYMQEIFNVEMNKSIQTYLQEKYPDVAGTTELTELVKSTIISELNDKAQPMFWKNPIFNMGASFSTGRMSVPAASNVICNAASSFVENKADKNYTVRKTGINDRVFVLRFHSGLPFYAYQGVTKMYDSYRSVANAMPGVGAHLYAKTGRGSGIDDSGMHDWRNELPTPMPYSKVPEFTPNGEELEKLYVKAEEEKVIMPVDINAQPVNYKICYSEKIVKKEFKKEDYLLASGEFNLQKWDEDKKWLENELNRRITRPEKVIDDFADGAADSPVVQRRIHIDYFIHYKYYQKIVLDELESREYLKKAMNRLDDIKKELELYINEVNRYNDIILFGFINCLNATGKFDINRYRIKSINYKYEDKFGVAREEIFAKINDDSEFSSEPLYRGFLHYCKMNPDEEPRRSIDNMLNERKSSTLKAGRDTFIAYQFETNWNKDILADMEIEIKGKLTNEQQEDVKRYYRFMITKVQELKKQFLLNEWQLNPEDENRVEPKKETIRFNENTNTTQEFSNTWECPECGFRKNIGNFCSGCGKAKPKAEVSATWECPECGFRKNIGNFCSGCGRKRD